MTSRFVTRGIMAKNQDRIKQLDGDSGYLSILSDSGSEVARAFIESLKIWKSVRRGLPFLDSLESDVT